MGFYGDQEEMSLVIIFGAEPTLFEILKEHVNLRILSCELPCPQVALVEVTILIYVYLEVPLHFLIVQPEIPRIKKDISCKIKVQDLLFDQGHSLIKRKELFF